jgi:hypothetical protein
MYAALIANITPAAATININGEAQDVSELGTSADAYIPGLRSAEGTITGKAFASPMLGNEGEIAITGGYTSYIQRVSLAVEANSLDWTPMSNAPTWRYMRPDGLRWSLTWDAIAKSDAATDLPFAAGAVLTNVAAYFTSGFKLSGLAFVTQTPINISRGSMTTVQCVAQGSGNLHFSGADTILSNVVTQLSAFTWSAGGAAKTLQIATLDGSRTYSMDAFARRLGITGGVGMPVEVTADWVSVGPVTTA